jgi:hypothetical protein
MTEGGERFGLALEPVLQFGISGDVLGQNLDGDRAIQARIGRLIDFAHPASPD